MMLVLQGGGRDIIRQVSTAVSQELLLPRGVQQPFLTAADVRRPAVGVEDIGVERRPEERVTDYYSNDSNVINVTLISNANSVNVVIMTFNSYQDPLGPM